MSNAEPLVLNKYTSLSGDDGADQTGTVNLNNEFARFIAGGGETFTISGDFSGTGGDADFVGGGTIVLTGNNTWNDKPVKIFANATVRSGINNALDPQSELKIFPNSTLDLNGFNQSVASLENSGTVDVGTGTLTIGGTNADSTFDGVISGTGDVVKTGTGTFTVNGTSTFTGTTTVSGGTLGGSGTLPGAVNVSSGGTVAPGNSPGILNTGDFDLQSGSTLETELGGTTPGNTATDHDQVNVTGTVTLAGTLDVQLFGGFLPSGFDTFVIINNDLADAVSGTFDGVAEGGIVTDGSCQ